MFPAECEYYRASSVENAVELLSTHADRDARPLAGGQGLVQDMKAGTADPAVLVDVGRLDGLGGLERRGDAIEVGALATHADLATAEALQADARVLSEAAGEVADRQVRNRGTVGGNLAEADPAADLPAAVLAAGATLCALGPDGERSIAAEAFFEGAGETALDAGELLTAVRVPAGDGGAYVRKTHPASGYATVGVAAQVEVRDGAVADARVAATGVLDAPTRLPSVEEALVGAPPAEADVDGATEAAREDVDDGQPRDDPAVSGEYRVEVLPAYAARAVRTALDRATGAGA